MEDEKNVINNSTVDENNVTFESNTPMEEAREVAQFRFESIADNLVKSVQIGQQMMGTLRSAFDNLANFVIRAQEISAAARPMLDTIQRVAQAIIEFRIPTITDERKQELISSHRKWGEYGWTLLPNAPFRCFYEFPTSIEMANAKMKKFCSTQEMERVFESLYSQKIKKKDLDAAILCYRDKQYKACSLILFGIIDAKLIRKQEPNGKRRPAGGAAVRKLRKQFEDGDNEKMLFSMLYCVNLFACLETFFADGNDFKKEPATINRNFVSHGMTRRSVRKRDCIQLFLVLNNLSKFLSYDL